MSGLLDAAHGRPRSIPARPSPRTISARIARAMAWKAEAPHVHTVAAEQHSASSMSATRPIPAPNKSPKVRPRTAAPARRPRRRRRQGDYDPQRGHEYPRRDSRSRPPPAPTHPGDGRHCGLSPPFQLPNYAGVSWTKSILFWRFVQRSVASGARRTRSPTRTVRRSPLRVPRRPCPVQSQAACKNPSTVGRSPRAKPPR